VDKEHIQSESVVLQVQVDQSRCDRRIRREHHWSKIKERDGFSLTRKGMNNSDGIGKKARCDVLPRALSLESGHYENTVLCPLVLSATNVGEHRASLQHLHPATIRIMYTSKTRVETKERIVEERRTDGGFWRGAKKVLVSPSSQWW